jgi:hypothetical protein
MKVLFLLSITLIFASCSSVEDSNISKNKKVEIKEIKKVESKQNDAKKTTKPIDNGGLDL